LTGGERNTRLRRNKSPNCQLETVRQGDFLQGTAIISNAEFVGDGQTRTGNSKQFKTVYTITDKVFHTVDNHRKGIKFPGGHTVGQGNVVGGRKVVVEHVLGGG